MSGSCLRGILVLLLLFLLFLPTPVRFLDDIKSLYAGNTKTAAIAVTVLAGIGLLWLLVYATPLSDFLGAAPPPPINPILVRYVNGEGRHCYTYQGQIRNFCERYGYREDSVLGTMQATLAGGYGVRLFSCARTEGQRIVDYHFTDTREECRENMRRLTAYRLGHIVSPPNAAQVSGELVPLYRCLFKDASSPRLDLLGDPLVTVNEQECGRRGYSGPQLMGFIPPVGAVEPTPTAAPQCGNGVCDPGEKELCAPCPADIPPNECPRCPTCLEDCRRVSVSPTVVPTASPSVGPAASPVATRRVGAHILFGSSSTDGFALITRTPSGQWATEIIDLESTIVRQGKIKVDRQGKAHIAYWIPTFQAGRRSIVKYATNQSGVWVAQSVTDALMNDDSRPSMALDSEGKAHIVYKDQTYGLTYTTNRSGRWQGTAMRDDRGIHIRGDWQSLALDTQGKAHVAYYDSNSTAHDLVYTTNKTGPWIRETLDAQGDVGLVPSLSLDGAGNVYILYNDASSRKLKYATNRSGAWVTEVASNNPGVHELTVDQSGNSHAVVYGITDGSISYLTNISGEWTSQPIDASQLSQQGSGFYPVNVPSLATDSRGVSHVAYMKGFPDPAVPHNTPFNKIVYTTNASGGWVSEDTFTLPGYGFPNQPFTSISVAE